ncbi:FecCD family ABC transporter permease [Archaeoglobus sp.]
MDATELLRVKEEYERYVGKKILFIIFTLVLIVVVAGISATLGSYPISVPEVYSIILKCLISHPKNTKEAIVWNLRMPRILLAIIAGAGLASSGAMTQGILRNPLATPYTLGISSAAGLGAAVAIILSKGIFVGKYVIVCNAFLFSLIPTFVILALARVKGATPETMILAGIAMMYIFSAITTILMYFAEPEAVKSAYFWMMGDLGKASWEMIPAIFVSLLICFILLMWKTWDINVMMTAGDEVAKSLGVNPERERIFIMLVSAFLTASIISFTGTIGFICLVAPHICRMVIGGDYRYLLPASALFGGALLLTCDTIARTILAPVILPVGVVTNCLGGPMFLYLLIRRKKEYW